MNAIFRRVVKVDNFLRAKSGPSRNFLEIGGKFGVVADRDFNQRCFNLIRTHFLRV